MNCFNILLNKKNVSILLYLDQQCYNDQKEFAGVYTSYDKAKEAAQILTDKYYKWSNEEYKRICKTDKPLYYSNKENWDEPGEYKLFYIREIVLDSVDFDPSDYTNFHW